MADDQVVTVRTPIAVADLNAVLRAEWRRQLGTEPSRASLLCLLAQWSLETGGGAASNNFNLAGIKYGVGCGFDYAQYPTREVIGGKSLVLSPPNPACRFRAYESLEQAAGDYLSLLRNRFGYAWPAVEAGDTQDFAHRLKLRGYYTADEHDYAAGLAARYAQLDKELGPDTQPSLPEPIANLHPLFVAPDPEPDDEPPATA